jgi:hypothetical protein
MAAATLGHAAVVGVSTGVKAVMATPVDHLVAYPVADPLEEHLVGSCGNAGDALALDRPSDHLLGKAVPALPTISVASSTASVSTMANLFLSIVSYPSFAL